MRIKRKGTVQQFSPLLMRPLQDTTTQAQDTNTFGPDPANAACHSLSVRGAQQLLKAPFTKLKSTQREFQETFKTKINLF